nr:hypothetical protein B0A51_08838 [Rachicladosporium sp. CCFEE 5018]
MELLDPPFTMPGKVTSPTKTPSKTRSLSDPPVALAPSPSFHENPRRQSKDDNAVPTTPKPIRRPDFLTRGLSLQMPSTVQLSRTVPLSPRLDQANIYSYVQLQQSGSPATSLPRHSRGLDFSRACTNLHHSTVAEQRDLDSSPVVMQRGMSIPGSRKMSISSMALDSPALISGSGWGSLVHERSTVSSSVGSVNMMGSESESDNSDEDASMAGEDVDDAIFATPQVHKLQNPSAPTPFNPPPTPGGGAWGAAGAYSPAAQSLMKTMRRTRLLDKSGKRSRKGSSSASGSGYSNMNSPRTTSPPPMRSIEGAARTGYFPWARAAQNRRESLAMGTDGLHLSSGNDSGDEASGAAPSTPGVVRRAVTRRGNLLPKTKGFARIRAALLEEAAPVDTEIRRESETMQQVRERAPSMSDFELTESRPPTGTAASSPNLLPAVPEIAQEDFGLEGEKDKGLGVSFSLHAHRNSTADFWNRFDPSMRTPPPPNFTRHGSSVMSDIAMDSPQPSAEPNMYRMRARAQSSASDASEAFVPPSAAATGISDDMHLKKFKRRREDDFDIATIKRRAVSPGMSAQNSPVLTHSPSFREPSVTALWGLPPGLPSSSQGNAGGKRDSMGANSSVVGGESPVVGGSRVGSTASNGSAGVVIPGKKLGLQGMVDTNDGIMKMSIE